MRNRIELNDSWRLTGRDFRCSATEDLLTGPTDGWLPASVPGDVHQDLRAANRIPDPYFALNADHCRWVAEKDWFYRCDFDAPAIRPGQRAALVFDGIDTYATIYLSGAEIARNQNMFTPIRVDVTDRIKPGERNQLAVRVASPMFSVEMNDPALTNWYTPRIFSRKAQYNYGWDIAPHLVSVGIWQPVYLEVMDDVALGDIHVRTRGWSKSAARLNADIEFDAVPGAAECDLVVEVFNPDGATVASLTSVCKPEKGARVPLSISPYRLWWPNGLGEHALYRIRVTLKRGQDILDAREQRFAIRKIETYQETVSIDESSFYFAVNGRKTFMKGINWTPADALPGTIPASKYRTLVEMVKDTGANMMRVWGGGVYEPELFYELCSENGILIWQDFMFSCAAYPETAAFIKEVKAEANAVVRRLRKHACLALWSGGNENDTSFGRRFNIGWDVLQPICKRLDPDTPRIPDSPFDPAEKEPYTPLRGDSHRWAHGTSYRSDFYLKDVSKFVSEIGHLSVPDIETLKTFIPENKLWPPHNEVWHYHCSDTIKTGWDYRIQSLFRSIEANGLPEPKSLEEFIEVTQTLQAEACRVWTEYYHSQPHCGGILHWNVCDCWPQISDAVINHNLEPKKAYYALKEAFAKISD